LLEVLATLILIGIVLPAVVGAVSAATAAAGDAKRKVEAVSLAQAKLAEISATSQYQAGGATGGSSGDFGADFPGYQWASTVEQVELSLSKVSVRVTWFGRGSERFVELTTMVYSSLGATEGTGTSGTGTGTGAGGGAGATGGGGTQRR
jgi:type II secretory pathway pseudopilin PulG